QQMGIGLDGDEIVNAHDLDIGTPAARTVEPADLTPFGEVSTKLAISRAATSRSNIDGPRVVSTDSSTGRRLGSPPRGCDRCNPKRGGGTCRQSRTRDHSHRVLHRPTPREPPPPFP